MTTQKEINLINFNQKLGKNNVSELMMHKVLYFQYGLFYNKFNRELITPNFTAWEYGPTEIEYRKLAKGKEFDKKHFIAKLNHEEYDYLVEITRQLLSYPPRFLVDVSHNTDAWYDNYEHNGNKSSTIPNDEIVESFKNVHI